MNSKSRKQRDCTTKVIDYEMMGLIGSSSVRRMFIEEKH